MTPFSLSSQIEDRKGNKSIVNLFINEGVLMKTKTYKSGKTTFRAYLKDCGNGWEVGFFCGTKPLFIGNFIHSSEANRWYSVMNTEIRTFAKRFTVGPRCPKNWYTTFLSDTLYRRYYGFLNKVFVIHNRKYNQAVTRDVRTYKRLNRNWYPGEKTRFLKAA